MTFDPYEGYNPLVDGADTDAPRRRAEAQKAREEREAAQAARDDGSQTFLQSRLNEYGLDGEQMARALREGRILDDVTPTRAQIAENRDRAFKESVADGRQAIPAGTTFTCDGVENRVYGVHGQQGALVYQIATRDAHGVLGQESLTAKELARRMFPES